MQELEWAVRANVELLIVWVLVTASTWQSGSSFLTYTGTDCAYCLCDAHHA